MLVADHPEVYGGRVGGLLQKPKLAFKVCNLGLQKAPEGTLVHTPHGRGEETRLETRWRGVPDWTGGCPAVIQPSPSCKQFRQCP